MQINHESVAGGIDKLILEGRLDIAGCQAIDIKFPAMTASPRKHIIVDLSKVSFLASIGIRLLITTAKSVEGRGGRLVLFNPDPNVARILDIAGITTLIPTVASLDEAVSAVVQ